MKVQQYAFSESENIHLPKDETAQLVLCFGQKERLIQNEVFQNILDAFPNAYTTFCSSSGEIVNEIVNDNSVTITSIQFKKTTLKANCNNIGDFKNSYEAGADLVSKFDLKGLKYILLFSDGNIVNGSELVKGIGAVIPKNIPVTGGLAGDGINFKSTVVSLNMKPEEGKMVAIAFYGNDIQIAHSSMGGWEPFGLERTVTNSEGNILYEIDNKSALDLYKMYLGKYADDLPGSSLLFPLSVIINDNGDSVVRTILSVNNEAKTMHFAGDIPMGSKVRFMKANFDRLIYASNQAAHNALSQTDNLQPQLALLISCVGRKVILANRVDEEIEAVKELIPNKTTITGFYSYGEISPIGINTSCALHNQTMTITLFQEV